MKAAILDTDTLSYVLDRRHHEVDAIATQYLRVFRRLSMSALTIAEVVKGITRRPDHALTLSRFLDDAQKFEIFPLHHEDAILAGKIFGALLQTGQQIGPLDPFIAATAIENGRVLITNNLRHYQRIVDLGFPLELENWRDAT